MTPRVRHAQAKARVYLSSHDPSVNGGQVLDLSPWLVQCRTDKSIRTEGTFSLVLVPPPVQHGDGSWLNVIRPNDVVNIWLSDGGSGYVRQMLGYVDSVQSSVVVSETGAEQVRCLVEGTDFTKALLMTTIYFNSYIADALAPQVQARIAGTDPLIDNLAGAELYRQGLRWFGTPADIIESHLLVLLGFQGQWRLPRSYPDIPKHRNGNIFTGGVDRREDAAHLRLVLRNRVGAATSSRYRRVAKAGLFRHVDLEGPPELRALAGRLSHPLGNDAPLLGTDASGKTRASAQFLADRTTTGNRDGVHLGTDIEAESRPHGPTDTLVYPVLYGTITDIRYDQKSGNMVTVRHTISGSRVLELTSQYLHLRSPDRREAVFAEREPSPCESARWDEDRPYLVQDRRTLLHRRFDCPSNPHRQDPSADPAHLIQVGCVVHPVDPIGITGATGTGSRRGGVACVPSPHLHFQLHYSQLVRDENGKLAPVDFYLDPQRFIPIRGVSTAPLAIDKGEAVAAAHQASADRRLDDVVRYRRGRREFRTLLDLLDRSYVERDHIDGFLASEQMLSESGNLLALMQSKANECMNELFFDLRLAGRMTRPEGVFEEDELGGNRDEDGRLAPLYVPAVILREYPFTTIARATYPRPSPQVVGDEGVVSADPLLGEVYGLPEAPGVFFSSREHPVLVRPCRPILTETPTHERQPADVATGETDESASSREAIESAEQARAAAALLRTHPRDNEADFLVTADQVAVAARAARDAIQEVANDVERLHRETEAFEQGNTTPIDRTLSLARLAAKAATEADRQLAHLVAGTVPDPPPDPTEDGIFFVGDSVDVALLSSDDPIELLARMAEIAGAAAEDAGVIGAEVAENARGQAEVKATAQPDEAERARRERAPSPRYVDTVTLRRDQILRMTVGRSDVALFNVFDLRSSDLQADLAFINRGIVPILSYESFARHGLRVREIFSTYTQLGADEGPDRSLRRTIARWAILNDHWFQHANQHLAGTIECLPLLDCRVGYRLDIPERDECYYVEGVRHEWGIDPEGRATLRTHLAVTRGQPMIRRRDEAILHVPVPGFDESDVVSRDSEGILVSGRAGHPLAELAREASQKKPAPAPMTVTERFLRSTIGSRYFPVLPWSRGVHIGRDPKGGRS